MLDIRLFLCQENGLEIIKDIEEETGNKIIKYKRKKIDNHTSWPNENNYCHSRYYSIYRYFDHSVYSKGAFGRLSLYSDKANYYRYRNMGMGKTSSSYSIMTYDDYLELHSDI